MLGICPTYACLTVDNWPASGQILRNLRTERHMGSHLDVNDPRYLDAAIAILRRHDNNEVEANIASAVRDYSY